MPFLVLNKQDTGCSSTGRRMPSLRAANGLPPMARELQVARQPVPMPSATNAANLQMVASLKNATTKVPSSLFYRRYTLA